MQRLGVTISSEPGYRRILWPTDLSSMTKVLFPHAVRLARRSGGRLIILHVLSPPALHAVPVLSAAAWQGGGRENRALAHTKLKRLTNHLRAKLPRTRLKCLLAEGDPADEILRTARCLKCDLILIGTHGHSGVAHLLIGSVADTVLRMAPCPVLTVQQSAVRVKAA